MLNVAMISKWHVHAEGYAKELLSSGRVKITAVWDEIPSRGKEWATQLGAEFESDLSVLLNRTDVDAVAVNAPTNLHTEILLAAAKAGKHIFTEKVLTLTKKEAIEIKEAVNTSKVKFCISFPYRCLPPQLFAKKVAEENLLGEISLMRARNAHNGASAGWLPDYFYDEQQCGGGAMIDLGAHPMYLSRWILGKPKSISSTFTSVTGKPVEDNAVSVIEFENKATAIVETGFVTSNSPFSIELYGTQGSLMISGPDSKLTFISNINNQEIHGWIAPTQLPQALPSPIHQWINGILDGAPIYFGIDDAVQLTELMEGAYISHREKRHVDFDTI